MDKKEEEANFDEEGVDPADITVLLIIKMLIDDYGALQSHQNGGY